MFIEQFTNIWKNDFDPVEFSRFAVLRCTSRNSGESVQNWMTNEMISGLCGLEAAPLARLRSDFWSSYIDMDLRR